MLAGVVLAEGALAVATRAHGVVAEAVPISARPFLDPLLLDVRPGGLAALARPDLLAVA